MATAIQRVSDYKRAARERLSELEVVHLVLPTARRMARNDPSLIGLADEIRADPGRAVDRYASELNRVAPAAFDIPYQFLTDGALADQIAAFAQAGLMFFSADPQYQALPLGDRRASGGSGTVTRMFRTRDRLLLETPRIVIRYTSGTNDDDQRALRQRFNLVLVKDLGLRAETEIVAVLGGRDAVDVCHDLLDEDAVDFAEPDFVESIGKRQLNDPDLGRQWHLRNQPNPGADISAFPAWQITTGEGVRLALIDNGFDTGHADLQFGNFSGWYRATADMLDADFVRGLSGMPIRDHGTACAGMAAARGNNGYGGAGVAYGAELMAIACLSDQIGTQSTLARALGYAAQPATELGGPDVEGADVIVCSLGPSGDASWTLSQTLRLAIDTVTTAGRGGKGIPVFWACTNGNYPIAADEVCSHPGVMAVGRSTNRDDDDGSGFGPELAFLAPGVDVYLPSASNSFATTTGTSFAAPCAAGVAALALAVNGQLTAAAVRQLLEDTCDKIGLLPYTDGRNDRFGFGRVNAEQVVNRARPAAPAAGNV